MTPLNQKALIASGSTLAGGLVTQAAGGNLLTGANAAANEVLNNYLTQKEDQQRNKAKAACAANPGGPGCVEVERWNALDAKRDAALDKLVNSCQGTGCQKAVYAIDAELKALGCTGPYTCDSATLEQARSNALIKAQALESSIGPDDVALIAYGLVKGAIQLGRAAYSVTSTGTAEIVNGVTNPVSDKLARVVPRNLNPSTLGKTGDIDVFVTNASELRGLSNAQIANKLTIPEIPGGFKIIEFPSSSIEGIASPVFRTNPGFIQGGRTAGNASEFVIPNGPIPTGATQWIPHQ